jgi:hypothetical protein
VKLLQGTWHFFGWRKDLSEELRLLLLVLFTGSLGSTVYSMKSFADYVGAQKLTESWFTYYVIQPFEGAGIALIFYLVVRGGFLAGASGDVKSVNPFGISAVAALVGIFSDVAFNKLREIFETLFKPSDARTGTIEGTLAINTKSLPAAEPGQPYHQKLNAVSGTPPYKWAATGLPPDFVLNPDTGDLTGPGATAAPQQHAIKVVVTDSGGASASADLNLTA